ncbi:MAG TPA: SEC-C metal-binding domain-containing protein, partial [Actinomycetota bacterium]|nr:SEC-C metal-binding domain-containing protein [Actinomycetota bacterium]
EYLARQEMAAREFDNDRYLLFEMDEAERAEYEAEYEPIYQKLKTQTDAEHDEVVELGGLYVLGTERHESRRIDNQLRGRSGRQGDPGESRFYLSLEDDLMRMFASDRVAGIMERLKWPDDEPITAKMVSKAVESAQRQIEELNFERRKNVLKYDDVMNTQRQVIYEERSKLLKGEDFKENALRMVDHVMRATVQRLAPAETFEEEWDLDLIIAGLAEIYPTSVTRDELEEMVGSAELEERVVEDAFDKYEEREKSVGSETMRQLERLVLLNIVDTRWREHLYEMDYLQEGIHLRAYGQKDPLTEYRREAFTMFDELTASIEDGFVRYIYRVELVRQDEPARPRPQRVQMQHGDEPQGDGGGVGNAGAAPRAVSDKVPRNAPCPCGSGKKYKKCHGAVA